MAENTNNTEMSNNNLEGEEGNENVNEPLPNNLGIGNNEEGEAANTNTKKVNIVGQGAEVAALANKKTNNNNSNIKGNKNTKKAGNNLAPKNNQNLTLKNTPANTTNANTNNTTATTVESPTDNKERPAISNETRKSLDRCAMNLLNHQIVLKLFHFQTAQYGAHKASDAYISKFADTMDKFLEIAQGIYGKISLKKYTLSGSSHTDENIVRHLNGMITYLREKIDDILDNYTDLINIRDELVGDLEQLKYLLTFK
jgi:hypothetical protein